MTAPARTPEEGAAGSPEVVVAGHVSLDVIPELYGPVRIEPGRLVVVGPAVTSTGGAVANTGLALHRLGVRVRLIAKVGADLFGRAVLDVLAGHDERLARDLVVSEDEVTSYTIVINPPGVDRTFLHCSGANRTFSARDVPGEKLAGARLLHFGYPPLMPTIYADGGAELREILERARARGLATSLDLCQPDPEDEAGRVDWRELLANVLPFVDVFAPSLDELLFMLEGRSPGAGAAPARAHLSTLADCVTGMGAVIIAIKLGEQGLYLKTTREAGRLAGLCDRLGLDPDAWRGCEVLSPCFRPRVVAGTTGAGDATIAGLVAAILRGAGPTEAATAATAVGACSVEALDPTSGIPPWPRIARRLAEGWPRLPVDVALGEGVAVERDAAGTMTLP